MQQESNTISHRPHLHVIVLIGIVVALTVVCFSLMLSDGLRNTIRSSLGISGDHFTQPMSESRLHREQEQIRAIASTLGLAADTHDLSSAVRAVIDERQALQGKYSDLTTRHNDLSTRYSTLSREHGELRKAKMDYEARVKNATHKLTGNLSSRLVNTAARQVTSTSGKAIPIIGIGFVAAFTALDVYDACEMIKELNEMNVDLGIPTDTNNNDKVCGLKVPTQDEIRNQLNSNWEVAYTSAANAANQAGKSFSMTPPTISAQQFTKQTCSIFNRLWFCQ